MQIAVNLNRIVITIGIIVIFIIILILIVRPLFKDVGYPMPTGKHLVGTSLIYLGNSDESGNNGLQGKIPVRCWYPTDDTDHSKRLPVFDKITSEAFVAMYGLPKAASMGNDDPSHSYVDAPLKEPVTPYPVIIFSHGFASEETQNLSLMEELASHGYVVFSFNHPPESLLTRYPDGTITYSETGDLIKESMKFSKESILEYKATIEAMKKAVNIEEWAELALKLRDGWNKPHTKYFDIRLIHIRVFLRQIDVVNETLFNNSLDLEKIGIMGHSFGGVIANYLAMDASLPIKAGINLDAPFIRFDTGTDLVLKAPFLFMYGTEGSLGRGIKIDLSGVNDMLKTNTQYPVTSISVKGAGHYNFSDMNLLPRFFKFTPLLGSIDGIEMNDLMRSHVLKFFNENLR